MTKRTGQCPHKTGEQGMVEFMERLQKVAQKEVASK
jgi:hypothetical protein